MRCTRRTALAGSVLALREGGWCRRNEEAPDRGTVGGFGGTHPGVGSGRRWVEGEA